MTSDGSRAEQGVTPPLSQLKGPKQRNVKHLQVHSAIDALNSFNSQQQAYNLSSDHSQTQAKNSRRKSESRGNSRYKNATAQQQSGKSLPGAGPKGAQNQYLYFMSQQAKERSTGKMTENSTHYQRMLK